MSDLRARCRIATDCLPASDYRSRLEALHAEMLEEMERLQSAVAAERAECAAICDRIAAESLGMFAFGASKCAEGIRDSAPPG